MGRRVLRPNLAQRPLRRARQRRAEKTRQAIMGDFDASDASDADDASDAVGAVDAVGAFDAFDAARMIGFAEALLHAVLPERDPRAEQAAALVSRIADNPGLRRV